MFQEELEDGNYTTAYTRFEEEDVEQLNGKRIKGHGKIVSVTNAEGELHPALVTTEDGAMFTPEELATEGFDGRHGFVDYEVAV